MSPEGVMLSGPNFLSVLGNCRFTSGQFSFAFVTIMRGR